MKKKLLWVADAGSPTGFARATHEILKTVIREYDVAVLGINYRGDSTIAAQYPYPLYAAQTGGDAFGVKRLVEVYDLEKPDLIVIQQDGWNFRGYVRQVERFINPEREAQGLEPLPVVAIVAVDGKNFQGGWLEGISHAIFWTEFARHEASAGGYTGPASVIPLGVDTDFYVPMSIKEARYALFGKALPENAFVVGNINRNQPRKRWDLTIKYFAEWVHRYHPENAFLFLHVAPTGDDACNVKQLAEYYGVYQQLALRQTLIFHGVSEEVMRQTYNCLDVQITTTQGEGFGLTTFEGMACGVSQIVPRWSALGELCKGAAFVIPCTSTVIGPPYVNVIGGVPDETLFIEALDQLYLDRRLRESWGARARDRAIENRFQWSVIGEQYLHVLATAFNQKAWSEETDGVSDQRHLANAGATA